jgi:protein-S-isoprenylcysteine O-methyltransferase Ste14
VTAGTLTPLPILYNRQVSQPSEAAKWGTRAAAAVQVAGRTRQGRVVKALFSGAHAAATSFLRVLHLLFLEVTGFLFLCIGSIGALASWREYHKVQAGTAPQRNLVIALVFSAMFLWFGITSFWRARRKNK